MKTIAMIISPEGFQDTELMIPKRYFEEQRFHVDVYSTQKGTAHGSLGATVRVEHELKTLNVEAYDAIVYIGGPGTPILRRNDDAIRVAKEAFDSGKIIAAICWSPTILAKAGILCEKKATVWNGQDSEFGITTAQYLEQEGAIYTDESVTVDGNIITANGPQAAQEFAQEIVKKLNE